MFQLGCGYSQCTTGSPFGASWPTWHFVVCNYKPPGNWWGEWPYTAGTSVRYTCYNYILIVYQQYISRIISTHFVLLFKYFIYVSFYVQVPTKAPIASPPTATPTAAPTVTKMPTVTKTPTRKPTSRPTRRPSTKKPSLVADEDADSENDEKKDDTGDKKKDDISDRKKGGDDSDKKKEGDESDKKINRLNRLST